MKLGVKCNYFGFGRKVHKNIAQKLFAPSKQLNGQLALPILPHLVFLWGHIKNAVHKNKPQNIDVLQVVKVRKFMKLIFLRKYFLNSMEICVQ